ncbi:MAG: LPS export ABC transporter permease LptG [Gammaproteobacteria bacterium]|jgi:lipopolysaccharide export system permease protein
MKLVDRYLAKSVIAGSLMVLLVLVALSGFVTFVGEFEDIGVGTYSLLDAVEFVLLRVPHDVYQVLPMAVLLGSLLGLGGLASHNELMVMRTGGISIGRLTLSAMLGALVMSLGAVVLAEFVFPPAQQYAEAMKAREMWHPVSVAGRSGLWARDGDTFVNVRTMSREGRLSGIYLFRLNDRHELVYAGHAAAATYSGKWRLKGLKATRFSGNDAEVADRGEETWQTGLDPRLLDLFTVDPNSLSISGLYRYMRFLEGNGLNASRYRLALWGKLVMPISLLVMVMLAIPFVFGPLRSAGTGHRLVVGMLAGIAFYVVNNMLMNSGEVFGLNPVLTASLPTLILALIAGAALQRVK